MEVKIYTTHHGNLSIPLCVGERRMRIRFVSKDNVTGYYATADESIQKAIESNASFGVKFRLQPSGYQPNETEEKPLIPIENITTWQEAREFLNNPPYSVPKRGLNTPAQIRKRAKELGLFFPKIKE